MGIDIGTTSVCGVVTDSSTGEILKSLTLANDSSLPSRFAYEKIQDPGRILQITEQIYRTFTDEFSDISAVGFTGQMHGILYLDKEGNPLSPLYTWQDGRGNEIYSDGLTYAEYLTKNSPYRAASGFGLTTHFFNLKNGLVPKSAHKICTVHDFVAMKAASLKSPVAHTSDGASLGFFDLNSLSFDKNSLRRLGIDRDILPEICKGEKFIGNTEENLKVAVAIGDNQASVFASLTGEGQVLVNVGTGSQISVISEQKLTTDIVETRPYFGGKYLITSCPLCGGYSYTLLKNFFQKTLDLFGFKCEDVYSVLNSAALSYNEEPMTFNTLFKGTRKDPSLRASITDISQNNFTPQAMTRALLSGICDELYEGFKDMRSALNLNLYKLVGSGNGVRQNPALKEIISDKFNMKLNIPLYKEEASYGASLLALSLLKGSDFDVQSLIKYEV